MRAVKLEWMYREFGRRLRDARDKSGMSQLELAKSVGLARTSITNIEKGRQNFTLHMAYQLAHEVGVPISILFPERPPDEVAHIAIPSAALEKYSQVFKDAGIENWVTRVIQSPVRTEAVQHVTETERPEGNGNESTTATQDHQSPRSRRASREKTGSFAPVRAVRRQR